MNQVEIRQLAILLMLLFGMSSAAFAAQTPQLPAQRGQKQAKAKMQASDSRADEKLPDNLIRLPMCRQATAYTCGVAALQSVLSYYGEEYREDDLSKKLKANYHDGTAYANIVKFSRSKGYHVDVHKDMKLGDLKALIDKHLPVICLLQAWSDRKNPDYKKAWDDGHYVVAIGYNQKNIFFMDPSTLGNYAYVPNEEFVDRWHDTDLKERLKHFGMVVSKDKPKYEPSVAKFME